MYKHLSILSAAIIVLLPAFNSLEGNVENDDAPIAARGGGGGRGGRGGGAGGGVGRPGGVGGAGGVGRPVTGRGGVNAAPIQRTPSLSRAYVASAASVATPYYYPTAEYYYPPTDYEDEEDSQAK